MVERKYDAVMFDMDGTLIMTPQEYWGSVVREVLRGLGVPSCDDGHIREFWFGMDRDSTIRECFGVEPRLFWDSFIAKDCVDLRRFYSHPYWDVPVLGFLKTAGYKIGLVTGARPNIAEFGTFLLADYFGRRREDVFDAVVVANKATGIASKPAPDGIVACLDELAVSPSRAFYVGNAKEDILAARAAGVKDIIVDRGEFEVKGISPSISIRSLYELGYLIRS